MKERPELRIVDEVLWEAVQRRIQKVHVLRGPGAGKGAAPRYLLTGLSKCGRCGGAIRVANGRDGQRPIKVYVCGWHRDRGDTVCDNSLRKRVDDVDTVVLDWIRDRVL